MGHSTFTVRDRHARSNWQLPSNFSLVAQWGAVLWIGIFVLPISLPGLIFPMAWQPYLLVTLFLSLVLYLFGVTTAPAGRSAYLLLLWLPLTLVVTTKAEVGWQSSGYLLLGLALYHATSKHRWLQDAPSRLCWLWIGVSLLLIGVAPSIVSWKSEFRLFYLPLYDLFATLSGNVTETLHANLLAGALVLLIPIVLVLLLPAKQTMHKIQLASDTERPKTIRPHQSRRWRQRVQPLLLALLLIGMLGMLLLTQSRGGYLGALIAMAIVLLFRWPRLGLVTPLLLGLIGYGVYTIGVQTSFDLLGADNTFGGADWRTPVWRASWQAFQDFAWTGIGIGNFRQVMPMLYPNPAINNEAATHAHNLLLQIGLDLGIPGLAAYLLFCGSMVGMAIAVLRRTRSPQATAIALGATWDGQAIVAPPSVGVTISTGRFMRQLTRLERTRQQHWALAAGCLAALVGMQVHGLLDAVTWGNKLAFLPWLIFAQITLLYRYHTAPPDRPRQEEHEL